MSEMTRPRGGRVVEWLMVAALLYGVVGAAHAAPSLRLEAEVFEHYGWYNIGGFDISPGYCSYASGFYTAGGLDIPGEWIELEVTFTEPACYTTRIDYQSDYGDTVRMAVRILDYPSIGEELKAEYVMSEGYGFG